MMKIVQLNDDCLLFILSKIPLDLALQSRLVCRRFKNLIELRCQRLTSLKIVSFEGTLYKIGDKLKKLNSKAETNATSIADDLVLQKNFLSNLYYTTSSQVSSLPPLFPNTINLVLDCTYEHLDKMLLNNWHHQLTTLTLKNLNYYHTIKNANLWNNLVPMTSLTSLTCTGDKSTVVSADVKMVLSRLKIFIVYECPFEWLFHLSSKLERLHIFNVDFHFSHRWERLLEENDALPNRHHMTHLQIDSNQSDFYEGNDIVTFISQIVNNFQSVTHLDISLFLRDSRPLPWHQLLVVLGQLSRLTQFTLHNQALIDLHKNVQQIYNLPSLPQVTTLILTNTFSWSAKIYDVESLFGKLVHVFPSVLHFKILSKKYFNSDSMVQLAENARKHWNVEVNYLSY